MTDDYRIVLISGIVISRVVRGSVCLQQWRGRRGCNGGASAVCACNNGEIGEAATAVHQLERCYFLENHGKEEKLIQDKIQSADEVQMKFRIPIATRCVLRQNIIIISNTVDLAV